MSTIYLEPHDSATTTHRWGFIDSLRGLAICGILLVNIPDIVGLGYNLAGGSADVDGTAPLNWLVQTRFVPIFTFLFGVSMSFIIAGAARRARRPWLALLTRFAALLGIGWIHSVIYPGEVLREYAISALLVLPLVLFVPRLIQLILGIALVVAAYTVAGGGLAATPGLIVLGAALATYGLPRALEATSRSTVISFGVSCVLLVPALLWQGSEPGDPRFSTPGAVAGAIMAITYVTGLSLLWRTKARRVVAALFDPLGRMSLSNYTGASVIVVIMAGFMDFTTMTSIVPVLALAAGILIFQNFVSRIWLRSFRYGPVEWVWRIITWHEIVPLRRSTARPDHGIPSSAR